MNIHTRKARLPQCDAADGLAHFLQHRASALLVRGDLSQAGHSRICSVVREHRFAPPRRWRFDLAWPNLKIAVEVEGGRSGRSRHKSDDGYDADMEKYNQAQMLGWVVLRVSGGQLRKKPVQIADGLITFVDQTARAYATHLYLNR